MENNVNRRMNAIKHPPVAFKDNSNANRVGNLNGVNVIGVALQGPSVPSIAVLHHNGPYNAEQAADIPGPEVSIMPYPHTNSSVTAGSGDVLPLQPKYLPVYLREYCSEPKELSPTSQAETRRTPRNSLEIPSRYSDESFVTSRLGSETSYPSIPAMAISSSTEVLVSIIENRSRRNSRISVNSKSSNQIKSPDAEFKSPSTEFTNSSVHSTPNENIVNCIFNKKEESKYCDTGVDSVIQDFSNSYV
ncbi:hypothetical protein WA026_001956 [Henosepilachna vigintioctopunctata]|uniref:Uncharacterized protein n=1 Tax=Henosepilachna vigintioctopunctata TaxID=420089 RepID=A0AAW1UVA8_9CUCU